MPDQRDDQNDLDLCHAAIVKNLMEMMVAGVPPGPGASPEDRLPDVERELGPELSEAFSALAWKMARLMDGREPTAEEAENTLGQLAADPESFELVKRVATYMAFYRRGVGGGG
jgi:hypothetical protein